MDKRAKIIFMLGIGVFIIVFIVINILIKHYEKEALTSPGTKGSASEEKADTDKEEKMQHGVTERGVGSPLDEGEPTT